MPLTVRLDPTLERALERYCAATGVSKSLVVQESLAAYLVVKSAPGAVGTTAPKDAGYSANYRAFADAGLIGGGALGQSADKAAVRKRALQRIVRNKTAAQAE